MPAGQSTYYRWAEDKPCTTNQTYGYELRDVVGRNACKLCAAEAAAEAAAAARREAQRRQREAAAESRRNGAGGSGVGCQSSDAKTQCKPINRGYTMGPTPITKRLQRASNGAGSRGGSSSSSLCEQHQQQSSGNGKDMYLWHAMSGTLVYCKSDEQDDE